MSTVIAATPAPLRLPFVRGEEVTYVSPMDARDCWPTRIRAVVYVQGATSRIRYYRLDGAPGVLTPADRLRRNWERAA